MHTSLRVTCNTAGVLFAGRADGMLEAWDLVERSHEPVLICTASTTALTSLAFSPAPPPAAKSRAAQQLLAAGASDVASSVARRTGHGCLVQKGFLR